MKRLFLLWHRRLGVILLIPLLLFSLSGLLHPVMRLTRPEPAQVFYPPPVWPDQIAHWSALPELSAEQVAGLRPVNVENQWLLQRWQSRGEPSEILHPQSGAVIGQGAAQYAEQLARHFSGESSARVISAEFIAEFTDDYPSVNRLLPVWQVTFDRPDGLTAFVDIRQDRLGAMSDHLRSDLMGLFRALHTWSFIPEDNPLRSPLLLLSMVGGILISASGLYLFIVLPARARSRNKMKQWHVWTGVGIAAVALAFSLSGLIRTIEKLSPEVRGIALDPLVTATALEFGFSEIQQTLSGTTGVILHELEGEPVWQVLQGKSPDIWLSARTGEQIEQGEQRLAAQMLQALPVIGQQADTLPDAVRQVNKFSDDPDYGFIDKRLPVLAMEFNTDHFYFDLRDNTLSLRVTDSDRRYSWIFRYLHKWRFAHALGHDGRDSLMTLAIFVMAISSITGVVLWGRRKLKQGSGHQKQKQKKQNKAVDTVA